MKRKITLLAIGLLIAFASAYPQLASVSDMKWHTETPFPSTIAYEGAYYYNGYIYVIGGCTNNTAFDPRPEIWAYNINTKQWINKGSFSAISDFTAVGYNNTALCLGGFLTSAAIVGSNMNIYNMDDNAIGTTSGKQVADYGAALYNNKYIYYIGGLDLNYAPSKEVNIFDASAGVWLPATGLPVGMSYIAAAIAGNKILISGSMDISGAYNYTSYVGSITSGNNQVVYWSSTGVNGPINAGMSAGSWKSATNEYAFFTGGSLDNNAYNMTYIYNSNTGTWVNGPAKPTATAFTPNFVTVIRNDSVYMVTIGGITSGAYDDNTFSNCNEWLYVGMDDNSLPVELTSYEAKAVGNSVELTWSTATEVNNYGFEVARKSVDGEYKVIANVEGHGNSSSPYSYSYTDKEAKSAGEYTYKLTQIDFDGMKKVEGEKTVTVSAPEVNELSQNYPNPCNPSTVIKYAIAKPGNVELKVYNTLGEEVATLANEYKEAGSYAAMFNAAGLNLPSGIYIYRIKAADFTETKKLMFIK